MVVQLRTSSTQVFSRTHLQEIPLEASCLVVLLKLPRYDTEGLCSLYTVGLHEAPVTVRVHGIQPAHRSRKAFATSWNSQTQVRTGESFLPTLSVTLADQGLRLRDLEAPSNAEVGAWPSGAHPLP